MREPLETPKAYLVQCNYTNEGDVIFASSPIVARRWGASEFNDGELGGMSVRRAPQFDALRGDRRAINRALLAMGWEWDDGLISEDQDGPKPFVSVKGTVYRSWWDWLLERESDIRERVRREHLIDQALEKFPRGEDHHIWDYYIGPGREIRVRFRIEGTSTWLTYWPDTDKLTCHPDDLPVVRAYTKINKDTPHASLI